MTTSASKSLNSLWQRVTEVVAARTFPVYAGLVGLYVVFRVGSFTNIADRVTDTPSYERVAHDALWDWSFYTGERGFTIPLFYKVFQSSESRIVAQLVLSTAAWLVLAAVVARCIRDGWLQPLVFATVLAFSLTTEVILWDTLLFSESLTFALLALLLAAWLVLVRSPRPLWAGSVLVLSLLWTFARDTNAYVVVGVGVLVALTLLRPEQRRLKLVLVAGCCAIFLLDYGSASSGKRWLQPMRDIVAHRVLPSAELKPYFVARGLDPTANWPESEWMTDSSRSVYARYLLSHAGYTLGRPFHGQQQALYSTSDNAAALIDPSMKAYDDNASHRFLPLPRVLEHVLFPRGVAVVLILLGFVLVGSAAVARSIGFDRLWLVPIGVLMTTYPHFLVVWHQSGVEVDRHALEAALLLRLALLLLAALAVDQVLAKLRAR